VVYGREPPELLRFEKGATSISMVEEQLLAWDLMLEDLKAHLQRAQMLMKKKLLTRRGGLSSSMWGTWSTSSSDLTVEKH